MKRWVIALSLSALLFDVINAVPQEDRTSFRVGVINGPAACEDGRESRLDPSLSAYAAHLSARLGTVVEICGVSEQEALALLQSGRVDLVRISDRAKADIPESIRPIMRARPAGERARTEFVIVGPAGEAALGPAAPEARGVTPLAANASEAAAMSAILLEGPSVVPVEGAMIAAIDDAFANAGADGRFILNVGRHRVFCEQMAASCDELTTLWRGFSPLDAAWSIRSDLSKEMRYRLIGIHAVLHREAPEAFAAIAGSNAEAFEPTEPWAFRFRNTLN